MQRHHPCGLERRHSVCCGLKVFITPTQNKYLKFRLICNAIPVYTYSIYSLFMLLFQLNKSHCFDVPTSMKTYKNLRHPLSTCLVSASTSPSKPAMTHCMSWIPWKYTPKTKMTGHILKSYLIPFEFWRFWCSLAHHLIGEIGQPLFQALMGKHTGRSHPSEIPRLQLLPNMHYTPEFTNMTIARKSLCFKRQFIDSFMVDFPACHVSDGALVMGCGRCIRWIPNTDHACSSNVGVGSWAYY